MKIYVASSWRNEFQPSVVEWLRAAGHEVYDFRNPAPGNDGFGWSQIDPEWKGWDPRTYRRLLEHPIALKGFDYDMAALEDAEMCVLVLPCGRSAHLELGHAVGRDKATIVFFPDSLTELEPELMYRMCGRISIGRDELLRHVTELSL